MIAALRPRLLAALIALFSPAIAHASPSRVAVVRPASPDAALVEASLRLEAELRAAGFEVIVVDAAPGFDARAQVEGTRLVPPPFATIAIADTHRGAVADVWVADHLTGKTLVRRVDGGAPRALAIRAVELLRASLLEIERPPAPPSAQPAAIPPDVARFVAAPSIPPATAAPTPSLQPGLFEAPTIEAGASLLQGIAGLGLALAPTIRVAYPLPQGFAARLSLLRSVVTPTLEAPGGTAKLVHQRVELEALRPIGPRAARAVPVVSLGAGLWGLRVQGNGNDAHTSRAVTAWAFVGDVGAGFALRITDGFAATLDLHALLILPEPIVRVAGVDAGRAGLPMLLGTCALMISP